MLTMAVPASIGICSIDVVALVLAGQVPFLIGRSRHDPMEALDPQEMDRCPRLLMWTEPQGRRQSKPTEQMHSAQGQACHGNC